MTHLSRIQHRTVENLLAGLCGGAIVADIAKFSGAITAVALISGVILILTDILDVEQEEESE